jgi:hypothetical protein
MHILLVVVRQMSWIRHNIKGRKYGMTTIPPNMPIETSMQHFTMNSPQMVKRNNIVTEYPLQTMYEANHNILCLDDIDVILYINLAHRLDRKQHCLDEISKIDPLFAKTHRIDAVYQKDNGALGCTRSHIKALQQFIDHSEWKTCLIMEDDFTFRFDSIKTNESIHYLIHSCKDFDVLLLGTGIHDYKSVPSMWNHIHKVERSQTTSAYIVTKEYASRLLQNFIESEQLIVSNGYQPEYSLDNYWKRLMPLSKWFTLDYRIGYQYENFSDIEHRICNYGC